MECMHAYMSVSVTKGQCFLTSPVPSVAHTGEETTTGVIAAAHLDVCLAKSPLAIMETSREALVAGVAGRKAMQAGARARNRRVMKDLMVCVFGERTRRGVCSCW